MSETLNQCNAAPNCVCSEYPEDKKHFIEPLDIPNTIAAQDIVSTLETAIEQAGGIITASSDFRLTATFTSKYFKFVDDVDAYVDLEKQVIHIRSASRAGYYDFGVNKKRVETIRKLFK